MNLNRKTLILAVAAGIGIVTVPVYGAAGLQPLNRTGTGAAADEPAGKTVDKPFYMPLEAKESTTAYYSLYDGDGASAGSLLVKDAGSLATYILTKPGYPVSGTKTLSVRISLTNGAKFTPTPYLICPHSAATTPSTVISTKGVSAALWAHVSAAVNVTGVHAAGGSTAYRILPTNQTPGQNSYTFIFPNGFTTPTEGSGACILTYTGATGPYNGAALAAGVSAVATIKAGAAGQDVKAVAEVTYDDFYGKVTQTATYSIISFVTALKADFSLDNYQTPVANRTAAEATIDVGKLSKQFIDKSNASQLEALAGAVVVTAVSPSRKLVNASGMLLTALDIIHSASIVVSGPTVGTLSKVTFSSPTTTPSCKTTSPWLAGTPAVATTSGSVGGTITVQVTGGATDNFIRFVASAAGTTYQGASGFLICLVADGTQIMNEGQLSITVNGITPTGSVVELGSAGTGTALYVARNGTTVRVLNIPDSKDAYTANIRLYNASTQEVNVVGSLYGMDGKLIADNVPLATPLKPYSVKNVKSADIPALAGGKTWTGRAWMIIQAPISADLLKVQTIMRSPTGALTNLSTDATD